MDTPLDQVFIDKYERLLQRKDYTISNVRKLSLNQIAENFRLVYNDAWGGHDNFKDMDLKTAQEIMQTLKPIYDKDIMIFVYYKNMMGANSGPRFNSRISIHRNSHRISCVKKEIKK